MKALVLFVTCAALAACYSPNLGSAPFACGSDTPICPDGYSCVSGTCMQGGESVTTPDGAGGCPDASIEPNNSYTMPFVTPVAQQKTTFTLTGLAICPAGDIDVYQLTTTAESQTLTASIDYDKNGPALDMQILNSNGMSIMNGTAMSGMTNVVQTTLQLGQANTNYFVQVQASMTSDQNTYVLSLDVSN
jgi:hypothetical protein